MILKWQILSSLWAEELHFSHLVSSNILGRSNLMLYRMKLNIILGNNLQRIVQNSQKQMQSLCSSYHLKIEVVVIEVQVTTTHFLNSNRFHARSA